MADRTIIVKLRAEVGQYQKALGDAARATEQIADQAIRAGTQGNSAMGRLANSARQNREAWTTAGTALAAYGAGVTALGASILRTGIAYNQLQQTSRAAMTTLLGSAEAANAQMDRLDDFARNSPFSKATFIEAQQGMLAFGIEAQKTLPYLDSIQNAVAAMGGSNQQISEIAFVMSQISAAAKITGQDLIQLGQRGINAAELIGSQMGMTGSQVREAITANALDAGEALDALAAGMSERFGGAADNVKNTFAGAMDRVKAAWRDFAAEIASPLVGPNGGGALVDLANQAADLMRAYQAMPAPAKVTATATVALSGAAALAAGSFLLLAPRIVATRDALAQMGPGAQRAAGAIGMLGKAFAGLAAFGATLSLVDKWFDLFRERVPEIEDVTNALIRMSQVPAEFSAAGLTAEFDSLEKSIGRITDKNLFEKMGDGFLSGISALTGGLVQLKGNRLSEATAEIDALDQALTGLAAGGNADAAARALDQLAKTYGLNADQMDDLMSLLPGYSAQLKAIENDALLAADGTSDLADASGDSADAHRDEAKAIEDAIDAMRQKRSEAIRAIDAELNYRAAIDDANESLAENGRTLDKSTEEGRKNWSALTNLASAWNNLSSEQKNARGAAREARQGFIELATSMGMSRGEARDLARELFEIPDRKVKVDVDTATASSQLESFIRTSSGRTISIGTRIIANSSGIPGGMVARASGGPIFGPGSETSDSIMARLSHNEHVLSAREVRGLGGHAAVAELRAAARGAAPGFARGGTPARYTLDQRREILRLEQSIRELTKSLNATGKEALNPGERAAATLDRLIARRDLRRARNEPARERREAILERLGDRRDALRDRRADLRGGIGDLRSMRQDLMRPDGIVGETQQALQAFKRSITDAGGTWTRDAKRMAADMMANARAIEANEKAIDAETQRRDALADSLAEHQQSLDAVRQAMDQLSSQVASNFLSNPFNASISPVVAGGGSVGPSPELLAAQDALSAAKGRYHFALNDGSLGEIARARAASAALAEMDQYQSQVDSLSRDLGGVGSAAEQAITGLAAFDQILAENTAAAKQFAETLTALAEAGLDGPLYEMLAASGDLGLALELLATGPAGIEARERAWAERDRVTAELGAQVANEVHGAHFAEQLAAFERAEALHAASEAHLATLVSQGAANDARRDALIQRQTDILANQIDRLQNAVLVQSRQLQNVSQQIAATKKGRG